MYNIDIFKNYNPKIIGKKREFSVMILIVEENGVQKIVLEKRALTLKSQPGDICLPGGSIDLGETEKEAAIRETMEELNIKSSDIEFIGPMDFFVSPYGHVMFPFVSKTKIKDFYPNKDEVDHVIKVPIKHFIENKPLIYETEIVSNMGEDFPYHLIENGKDYNFSKSKHKQYFYKYNNYVIWGFTAQVVKSFIDIINN
ncbi:MAG: CoA pyrophosphatase [Clostridium sp.]|nr:CoA pyrophosphatase [Clostridium sp.]